MAGIRILVTGSRKWVDRMAVQQELFRTADAWHTPLSECTVVHGAARGLDTLAHVAALSMGMQVEAHPADWDQHPRKAGPIRNQAMIDAGAAVCLAFPLPGSIGTWDCIRRANKARILVVIVAEVE